MIAGFSHKRNSVIAGTKRPVERQPDEVFGIVGAHLDALPRSLKSEMEVGRALEHNGRGKVRRQRMLRRSM